MSDVVLDEESDKEMPWFGWCNKEKGEMNYKAKLEHKLLLARQDPEPIFDLTDCNLSSVPSGVYSWCKVCRKELLLLQNNKLKSLSAGGQMKDLYMLRVLDLHNNRLPHLPNEIGLLTNLEALYLQFNQLKSLPDSIKLLTNLQVLSLKGNPFKMFPEQLCHLSKLNKLDISATLLKRLPSELCRLCALTKVILDAESYVFPPEEVCMQGWEQIKAFLCKDCGIEYCMPTQENESAFSLEATSSYSASMDNWNRPLHTQDHQHQARVEIEKSLQALYDNLSKLTVESQNQRDELYKNVMQDQNRLDEELSTAQHKKSVDKEKLLIDLYEVEKDSSAAIQQLLELNSSRRNTDALLEELEKERIEFENFFTSIQNENVELFRKEVLETMERALQKEYHKYQLNLVRDGDRKEITAKTQMENLNHDRKLFEIMAQTDKDQKLLIKSLLQEEAYQKKALAAILIKKDKEYGQLTEQIAVIENELLNLTFLELKKQDLRLEFEKSVSKGQREVLTRLLIHLLTQQDDRKREFEKRLDEIEAKRQQEQVDFWLIQCQRLMSNKPEMLKQEEKLLEEEVKEVLRKAGAEEFTAVFANANTSMTKLQEMTSSDLKKLGICDVEVQDAILKAVREQEVRTASYGAIALTPTAPPWQSQRQMSLRTRFETECVVCMDRECTVLFLNCGHVCCCDGCGPPLKTCPLCRSDIERLIYLQPEEF